MCVICKGDKKIQLESLVIIFFFAGFSLPNVLKVLVESFDIKLIGDVKSDVSAMVGKAEVAR